LREYAVGVVRNLDPSNPHIEDYLAGGNPQEEYSLMEEELRVNPFIRWNDPALEPARKGTGRPLETEYQRWRALMDLH
jgi:hydroxyacylglutathione hydrolase